MRMRLFLYVFLIFFVTGCSLSPSEKEMDVIQEINRKMDVMLLENHFSTNPEDIMLSHKEEVAYMVEQGNITLPYFLSHLSESDEDGLREFIMVQVCICILGNENTVEKWETPRDWYEQYTTSRN